MLPGELLASHIVAGVAAVSLGPHASTPNRSCHTGHQFCPPAMAYRQHTRPETLGLSICVGITHRAT